MTAPGNRAGHDDADTDGADPDSGDDTEPGPVTGGFTVERSVSRFRGRVISLRTDTVRMPDGSVSDRDIVVHPGAVAIVALDESDRVVLVHQHRQPVGRSLDELPAGLLDVEGESGLAAAQRELYEEAALTASRWDVLVDIYTSPGMTDESVRIYLARELRAVAADERFEPEHEEVTMTVRRTGLDEAVAAALAGELVNSIAVAGVLAAQVARASGWAHLRPADAHWSARPER